MRELSFLNKGVTNSLRTDKREKNEKGGLLSETFYSDEGIKGYLSPFF